MSTIRFAVIAAASILFFPLPASAEDRQDDFSKLLREVWEMSTGNVCAIPTGLTHADKSPLALVIVKGKFGIHRNVSLDELPGFGPSSHWDKQRMLHRWASEKYKNPTSAIWTGNIKRARSGGWIIDIVTIDSSLVQFGNVEVKELNSSIPEFKEEPLASFIGCNIMALNGEKYLAGIPTGEEGDKSQKVGVAWIKRNHDDVSLMSLKQLLELKRLEGMRTDGIALLQSDLRDDARIKLPSLPTKPSGGPNLPNAPGIPLSSFGGLIEVPKVNLKTKWKSPVIQPFKGPTINALPRSVIKKLTERPKVTANSRPSPPSRIIKPPENLLAEIKVRSSVSVAMKHPVAVPSLNVLASVGGVSNSPYVLSIFSHHGGWMSKGLKHTRNDIVTAWKVNGKYLSKAWKEGYEYAGGVEKTVFEKEYELTDSSPTIQILDLRQRIGVTLNVGHLEGDTTLLTVYNAKSKANKATNVELSLTGREKWKADCEHPEITLNLAADGRSRIHVKATEHRSLLTDWLGGDRTSDPESRDGRVVKSDAPAAETSNVTVGEMKERYEDVVINKSAGWYFCIEVEGMGGGWEGPSSSQKQAIQDYNEAKSMIAEFGGGIHVDKPPQYFKRTPGSGYYYSEINYLGNILWWGPYETLNDATVRYNDSIKLGVNSPNTAPSFYDSDPSKK